MKKLILPLFAFLVIVSCSTDDETLTPDTDQGNTGGDTEDTQESTGNGLLRITEVDAAGDLVTITNFGDGNLEVGDYFLCLGPGTYATIGGLTDESTSIEPNASLTVSYDVNPTADGLGVFTTNDFSSTDASILLDYVQYGADNQARVAQAVTAGRWDNASSFVAGVNVFSFTGDATDVGVNFWEGEEPAAPTPGVLRILAVDATNDVVTLVNFGDEAIEVGNYWLCLGPGTYARVGNIASGETSLEGGENIELSYDVDPVADGLSIFSTNTFGSSDPDVLLDYVQWGAASQPRSAQAVTAGRWDNTNNFVPQAASYEYAGGAGDVGVTFWE